MMRSSPFIGASVRFVVCVLTIAVFGPFIASAAAQPVWPYGDETKEQKDARMEWWREARFGMFIHWGVYAVPAGTYKDKQIGGIGEWIMSNAQIPVEEYRAFAAGFNPVKYNPDAWVRLAKEAGMKYIVITSKHHDGFALFDSKVTDWDIVDATPYGKDLLKPLAEACRKHKIKLGFYYSQAQDWTHPGGGVCRREGNWDAAQEGSMEEYIKSIAVPQVQEILSNYGDIAVLWWDTPCGMNKELAAMFEPVVSAFPGIITNNRLGGGYAGDTETPEQHIPATGYGNRDWETCMTMNDTWGFKSYDDNWKSNQTLIRNLIDIASKGGNYLLNVGPTPEGEIPAPSIERLKVVGKWMKVNSEAIYGTTASPFAKLGWGRCTTKELKKGTRLYFHVFDWPSDGKLLIGGLKNKVKKAKLLDGGKKVKAEQVTEGVLLSLPDKAPDSIASVIAVEIEGTPEIEKVLPGQAADGSVVLYAEMADIHNNIRTQTAVEEKNGIKNIGFWTHHESWIEWQFQISRAGSFQIVADTAAVSESQAQMKIADETLSVKFASTTAYDQFKPQVIGSVQIEKPGTYKLELRPNKQAWSPVNLRSIKLVPQQN